MANIAVRLELPPAVIVEGAAAKLVIVGVDAAFTIREIVVVTDKVPEVPLMVTVNVPVAAVLPAVRVSVLVPVVKLGLNDAVTPAGKSEAVRLTLPVNPFSPVTAI